MKKKIKTNLSKTIKIKSWSFLLLPVFLFIQTKVFGQETTHVTYKIITKELSPYLSDSLNPRFKNLTEKVFNSADDQVYELFYNQTQSLFRKQSKMATDKGGNRFNKVFFSGIRYINLKDSTNLHQKEFFGQIFNIQYPINRFKWTITKESKYIGKYLCFKAMTSEIVEDLLQAKSRTIIHEVWFTPSIPVPFGPDGFGGLPGLILEYNTSNGIKHYYVAKIERVEQITLEDQIDLDKGQNISETELLNEIREKINSLRGKN